MSTQSTHTQTQVTSRLFASQFRRVACTLQSVVKETIGTVIRRWANSDNSRARCVVPRRSLAVKSAVIVFDVHVHVHVHTVYVCTSTDNVCHIGWLALKC